MKGFPFDDLERLACRIYKGEVVFFVGSGFSIDSERNTASRMVGRLVVRFYAMCRVLERFARNAAANSATALEVVNLPESFVRIFKIGQLPGADSVRSQFEKRRIFSKTAIAKLAKDYYVLNDWIANAYNILLEFIKELEQTETPLQQLLDRISRREATLLREVDPTCPGIPRIDPAILRLDSRHRGKMLFLDTQGFDDSDTETFAGCPLDEQLEMVRKSYKGRLFPRHFVLARLAREGFCPVLVTTNFDLLLEGALRLSGFRLRLAGENEGRQETLPPSKPGAMDVAVITRPEDFFEMATGYESVMLLKIHGCVRTYRELKKSAPIHEVKGGDSTGLSPQQTTRFLGLQHYLPSLVFTFREIQNWRQDRWSRDYLRTLLRTRTMAFCGYSAADPVIHDTHRSVYEEMSDYQAAWAEIDSGNEDGTSTAGSAQKPNQDAARAFFFGECNSQEFHGIEILRASSRASDACEPRLTSHQNYLGFHFRNTGKFPGLDELMLWLYHRVIRERQRAALDDHLHRIVSLLCGGPSPESQLDRLRSRFDALRRHEEKEARGWGAENARSHLGFTRCIGWTYHFYAGLLRELTFREAVQQQGGPAVPALYNAPVSHRLWYFPGSQSPDWTAWTVVVEVAIRRLVAAACEKAPGSWLETAGHLEASPDHCPSVLFCHDEGGPALNRLHIVSTRSQAQKRSRLRRLGAFRSNHAWVLTGEGLPWPMKPAHGCPTAKDIWNWAASRTLPPNKAQRFLGIR